MNSQTFQAATEEEMIALGERLAALLPSRALVFLQGDLGAGKTTLVKGIAKGLRAAMPDEVSSPTFTLIHEYGDPVRMYHIDLYRLDSPRQLATLGLDEIFEREAVVVVEWPEKFARWLPRAHLTVKISAGAGARTITVESARESLTPH